MLIIYSLPSVNQFFFNLSIQSISSLFGDVSKMSFLLFTISFKQMRFYLSVFGMYCRFVHSFGQISVDFVPTHSAASFSLSA